MKDINTAKTITIRISSEEEKEILRRIVRETGCRQISKALLRTADGYGRMCELMKSQMDEIKRLKIENQRLQGLADIIINTGMAMKKPMKNSSED